MLNTALRQELIELITLNLRSKEILALGSAVFREFDPHKITGTRTALTISDRRLSTILVEYAEDKKQILSLLEFLIQINGLLFLGRQINIEGIESLLENLSREGLVYSKTKRKLVKTKEAPEERSDWGALREGKTYPISIASMDICRNSALVRKYGACKMKKLYSNFWMEIKHRLVRYNGRIWNWAGDGGIIAFALKDHVKNSIKFALEVQATLPLFFMESTYPIKEPFQVRMGIDSGKIPFSLETGTIVSEIINYASHLEKGLCNPGQVAISDRVYNELPGNYGQAFESAGIFEGIKAYRTPGELDRMITTQKQELMTVE